MQAQPIKLNVSYFEMLKGREEGGEK